MEDDIRDRLEALEQMLIEIQLFLSGIIERHTCTQHADCIEWDSENNMYTYRCWVCGKRWESVPAALN